MRLKTIYILSLWLTAATAGAQTGNIVSRYVDSLKVAQNNTIGRNVSPELNPYYFELLFPTTYYSNVAKEVFSLDSAGRQSSIAREIMKLYATHPDMMTHYDSQFTDETTVKSTNPKEDKLTDDIMKEVKEAVALPEDGNIPGDIDIGLQVKRPNFWKLSGSSSLQFTQNYFSENWYKGGNNNATLLATLSLSAVYNDTKKISWENRLNMRLGFITTTSDTCHTFLTNNDLLQLNTKFGYKAAKSWNYTISAEAKTQFMPGYRSNNRLRYSDFASPLDVAVSVGMDYKPSVKNGSLSVALLPLSYKMRYISSDNENIHKVYNFIDRSMTQDYGSRIEVNCTLKILKNITWRCRSYCFTSYEYVEAELENVLSFAFSKYVSSEVNTLWRFDDSRNKQYYDSNLGYFQFKEYFTLGLSYNF